MSRSNHRARSKRSHRIAKRILAVVVVLAVVVSTGLYFAIKHLDGNITGVDISKELGNHRPTEAVKGPLNILIMGDDTRKGQGPAIGGQTPGLSDTTILLHVSANRKFAYGVSLPRDAMVQRPACRGRDGTIPAGLTQFNAAYALGGPGCTIKTVEQLTGIRIDHFVVIKFRGFKEMVDALGGVTVCLPHAVDDNYQNSNIHFPAGTYKVSGEQALNYVRERAGLGDGSDLDREKRQQAFIASMISQAMSAGTLANPVRLYDFLDAATKSLITDKAFGHLGALVSLGESLKNIGLSHIKFITVPYQAYPPNTNRVEWAPNAKALWKRIKYDKQIGDSFDHQVVTAANTPDKKPSKHKSGSPSPSPSSRPSPSTSQVDAAHAVGLCA